MKYLKMLGLAAIAAAALMVIAGPASATTLTSPANTKLGVGAEIKASTPAGTHAVLDSPIGKIECNGSVAGKITNAGGGTPTVSVEGSLSTLSFTGCTTATVHVLKNGTLKITSSGGGKGALVSNGAEVTVETFGLHCIYATSNTAIGTVTGGSPATLAISATIPRTGGKSGAFCGSTAPWTGSYTVTSPNPLLVD